MGVDLPTTSRELLPPASARAVAPPAPARGLRWGHGLVLVLAALVPLAAIAGPGGAVGRLPWVLATFAAAVVWFRLFAASRGRLRVASLAFGVAASAGLLEQLLWAYGSHAVPGLPLPAGLFLLVFPLALIGTGGGFALGWRWGRGLSSGLTVDLLLLLLTTAVALLRWGVEPLTPAGVRPATEVALLALLQGIALAPVVPVILAALHRRTPLHPVAAVLLLGATGSLVLTPLLFFTRHDPRPLLGGDVFSGAGLAGWALFAAAGWAASEPTVTAHATLTGRRIRGRVRKLLVPATTLFVALVAVDLATGPRPRGATVVALAALGLVLAFRTAQAFTLVDRGAQERRQLAHTQALVEVTHSLAGTTDLNETLRVISESARDGLRTRGAGIELMSDDGQELVTRAAVGLPAEILGLHFPVKGSFTGWVVQHGEARATVDASRDPYILPQSLVFLGQWPVAAAPIRFRGETLGALFACIRAEPFEPEELQLIGAMAEQAAIAIQNARLFEQVMVLSVTDPLTGLANRRQLERELSREFAAAGRGRDLVAVIFDLDDFKDYNDAHGHLAGDEALQAFATSLQAETRAMNLAARYGGDEFVVLLAGADAAGARAFLRRIRTRFKEASLALGRGRITVSAGLAAWAPEMQQPDELLRRADDELYRAKSKSRT